MSFKTRLFKMKPGFLLCLSIWLVSCAQVVSPTGGKQDTTPPQMLKSEPLNGSINFSGKKIQLNFNEYIQLKDIGNQLIISPLLKKVPEVKVKNKTLTLEFDDTLKANTTYTFNFGNSITDFTEGNVLENYQFVFSTGSFLDSLSVSGNVNKSFNHGIEKGTLVMLYAMEKCINDSFPYKVLPDYFGKTNEQGSYRINNVRAGKYKIFALKEGNSNYLFDSDDEQIAFVDSIIPIEKPQIVNLSLFQEPKSKLILKRPIFSGIGQIILAFSKATNQISLESLDAQQKFSWNTTEVSSNKDTVRFWYAGAIGDSIKLKVMENGISIDTVQVKVASKANSKGKGDRGIELAIKNNLNSSGTLDLNKSLELVFQQPLKNANSKRIVLSLRKDTVPFTFTFIDSLHKHAQLNAKFVEDSAYKLLIPQGVFEDYTGLKNDTNRLSFRIESARTYGNLKLKVKLAQEANYILQLLDEKESVISERTLAKSQEVVYEFLKPGVYKLKLIEDRNSNGKWDSGKFLEKKQAERTFYYGTSLTVRSNWDLEELWDLSK